MKVKLLQIKFYVIHQSFVVKINEDSSSEISTIQGQHLTLRCRHQKWPTPARDTSTGYNYRESRPSTSTHRRCLPKEIENNLHIVNQQDKV
jgi:hypothetical protein